MVAPGLHLVTERTGDGVGRPVFDAENGEELMHVQSGVAIVLGNRCPESPGTLYISTKQIVWLSDTERAKGYAVDFLSVSLHAVSTDPESYPSPCLYTQIDTGAVDGDMEDSDPESDESLNLSEITEMRLVPSDPTQLDTLFAVFCECAELNPDPREEEEDDHNWVFSADQLEEHAADDEDADQSSNHAIGANGNHDLAHSVVQLQINDQRFADAEEMEQEMKNGHH